MFLINVGGDKCVRSHLKGFPFFSFLTITGSSDFYFFGEEGGGGRLDQMAKMPFAARPACFLCPEKQRKIAAQ